MPTPHKPSTLPQGFDRLERVIAQRGLASRREAKSLIVSGEVTVNGKIVREPGFGIDPNKAIIEIKSAEHHQKESYLVYKSRGIETNKTSSHSRDLHDQFPKLKHLHPIGRLDKDSEGLIIMSNDGTLAKALTKVDSNIGKKYEVTVREMVTNDSVNKMSSGIMLDGVITKKAELKKLSDNKFSIVLHEGRKHQIRRMAEACRLTIEKLVRIQIGELKMGAMKPGSLKLLSPQEIKLLKS